jgi:Phospholipase_D-nuclease N-terminal
MFLTTFWEVLLWMMFAALWLLALAVFVWVLADVFRRRDLTGWGKAGWVLLVFVLPLLGALIYLCARPKFMDTEVVVEWAPSSRWSAGSGSGMSPAEEIAYAQGLLAQGTITQAEFEDIKQRILP